MKCYYHPEIDAFATCSNCGKAICKSCSVNVAGRLMCQQCLATKSPTNFGPAATKPTNSLAIVSVILAVMGLCGCLCYGAGAIVFGIPAAITGYIARKKLSEPDSYEEGLQLATLGLGLGIAEIVLSIVVICLVSVVYGAGIIATYLQN
jgi:hypothetical protein